MDPGVSITVFGRRGRLDCATSEVYIDGVRYSTVCDYVRVCRVTPRAVEPLRRPRAASSVTRADLLVVDRVLPQH